MALVCDDMFAVYFKIAKTNLNDAVILQAELDKKSEAISSDSAPNEELIVEYWANEKKSQIRRNLLISIVFFALSAESIINAYGIFRTSKSYFDSLDKLGVVDKWLVVPRVVTGKSINSDAKGIQGLKSLVSLRNKLVHHKIKILPYTPELDIKYVDIFISFDDAKKAKEAIIELSRSLLELDRNSKFEEYPELESTEEYNDFNKYMAFRSLVKVILDDN